MDTVFIYALCDPDTGMVRYVGKSIKPKRRYQDHLLDKKPSHKVNWINSLKASNKIPTLKILEKVNEHTWKDAEIKWVSYFKIIIGEKLTNMTEGGDQINQNEETKIKISLKSKEMWANPEFRKARSEKTKKRWTPEFREKRSRETKKQWTPEFREKRSRETKEQWTPEFREKRSLESQKQWNEPLFREMNSKKAHKQWEDPLFREKMNKLWQTPEFKKSFRFRGKK